MKNLSIVSLIMFGIIILAVSVQATTVSLSPSDINLIEGENFNITIIVNPENPNYTVKAELKYPADLIHVKSFSFGSGWMPISQQNYDLIDNENGVLIKSAGYPGGFSSSKTFGIVSFHAKKTGSGLIEMGENSLILDIESQDVFSGAPKASFAVETPLVVPPKETVEKPTPEPEIVSDLDLEPEPIEETILPEEDVIVDSFDPEEGTIPKGLLASLIPFEGDIGGLIFPIIIIILYLVFLSFVNFKLLKINQLDFIFIKLSCIVFGLLIVILIPELIKINALWIITILVLLAIKPLYTIYFKKK